MQSKRGGARDCYALPAQSVIRHFCKPDLASGEFSTAALYECLTRDKPEMLETYLAIYQILQDLMLL